MLLLGLLPPNAEAQTVYKRQLPDGSVEFTDQRPNDASPEEAIELVPVQTISSPPVPTLGPAADEPTDDGTPVGGFTGAYTVSIASPKDEEAIRANAGNFAVQTYLEPPLQDGHEVFVSLDGEEVASSPSLNVDLSNIDRGAHQVFAIVRDANGEELGRSSAVKFYVLRVSVLSRQRAP